MKAKPRNVELRQKGKHFTVIDDTGRVYAQETDRGYAESAYKQTLTGLGRAEGNRVGPKRFKGQRKITKRTDLSDRERFAQNFQRIDWGR